MDTPAPLPGHHHAVQFYGSDQSLFTTVSGFLGQGFIDGNPGILIATPAHTTGILEHLKGRFIDVERAKRVGDLVILDAQETLALFMADAMPDSEAFERSVGQLVGTLLSGRSDRTLIRAY